MLYFSLFFSLSCYCFLRFCTLNNSCLVQRWKFASFSSFNLAIFPISVEILHFGKHKAFYLSSLLSRKHFSVTAFNSSYSDKLLFKCSRMEEWREMCQSIPLAMLRKFFFLVLGRYRSYGNKPECRPASCKCSCSCFYYLYLYSSRPKTGSKHGWATEHANTIKIHPGGTIYGVLGPPYSQHPRILWSI